MGQRPKKRPEFDDGFVRLIKSRLNDLDKLPAALWRLHIKLLAAAHWGDGNRGHLGFSENPWSLHDIAHCVNLPLGTLIRDMKRLQAEGLVDLVEWEGYDPIWYVRTYETWIPPTKRKQPTVNVPPTKTGG